MRPYISLKKRKEKENKYLRGKKKLFALKFVRECKRKKNKFHNIIVIQYILFSFSGIGNTEENIEFVERR